MEHTFKFDTPDRRVSIDGDNDIWQTVPPFRNTRDYRYDRGGDVYQAACMAFWDAEADLHN